MRPSPVTVETTTHQPITTRHSASARAGQKQKRRQASWMPLKPRPPRPGAASRPDDDRGIRINRPQDSFSQRAVTGGESSLQDCDYAETMCVLLSTKLINIASQRRASVSTYSTCSRRNLTASDRLPQAARRIGTRGHGALGLDGEADFHCCRVRRVPPADRRKAPGGATVKSILPTGYSVPGQELKRLRLNHRLRRPVPPRQMGHKRPGLRPDQLSGLSVSQP